MKPILFNQEMVKAILEGRKTVTRRLVKQKITQFLSGKPKIWVKNKYSSKTDELKPPYQSGDILYVRETWCNKTKNGKYAYKADKPEKPGFLQACYEDAKWHPSIHMPKEAARIFLKVVDVRVEKVKDITEKEAIKEGFIDDAEYCVGNCARGHFINTIKEIYPEATEDTYLWVIEFERISKEEAYDRSN